MIALHNWIAFIPPEERQIAFVGENAVEVREFFLPDLAYQDYAFWLDLAFDLSTVTATAPPRAVESTTETLSRTVNANGDVTASTAHGSKESYTETEVTVEEVSRTDIAPLVAQVREDGVLLTWTILAQQTQLPGTLYATLRAVGPDNRVKKSAVMTFTVAPTVAALPAASIPLSEHEQMERAMVEAFNAAADEKIAFVEQAADEKIAALEQAADEKIAEFSAFLPDVQAQLDGVKTYVDAEVNALTSDMTEQTQATLTQANAYTDEKTAACAGYDARITALENAAPAAAGSPLAGKKIVYDGGSITADNGGYAPLIAAAVGGTYQNLAVTSGRLCTSGAAALWHSVADNLANLPSDGDLYCFEGCSGDYWGPTELGDFSPTDFNGAVDTSTLCGAMESIIRYCLENFVGKPLCFVISHKAEYLASANAGGYTYAEYCTKMRGVCEKYAVPYYDAYMRSGFSGYSRAQKDAYTDYAVGLQPDEEGYKRYYVPQLISLFESIMPRT